ncbi:trifunctional dihydropteroate synthetase [Coelomomyces lativittatus]|nr:trifunctional dihydropteroate synthetase [Coelomomyces lativittatus]
MNYIKDLSLSTIIGLNPWEREEKQMVVVNLTYDMEPVLVLQDVVLRQNDYRRVANCVQHYVESTQFKTLEALCYHVVVLCLQHLHLPKVTVRIDKPSAILFAQCASIEISRNQAWLSNLPKEKNEISTSLSPSLLPGSLKSSLDFSSLRRPILGVLLPNHSKAHTVYLALGSNLGDRAQNLNEAMRRLQPFSTLADTSFLYETKPMYLEDQPNFLNAACKIYTDLEPLELLAKLKIIEEELGRDLLHGIRNGPRVIDLDILFYDYIEFNSPSLEIPHPRIMEREFVLRPLADMAPDFEHPKHARSISKLLALHQHAYPVNPSSSTISSKMLHVVSFSPNHLWSWKDRTYVMGILNVTPDSFSDGGDFVSLDAAVACAQKMVNEGVDVIDLGGQSTRPGATEISAEEELQRVLPVVKEIKKVLPNVVLSIDTFWASVAEACVKEGVHFINDVTGGTKDPKMLKTMAQLQVPVCLMHTRHPPHQPHVYHDLIQEIEKELCHQVNLAIQAGIYRWHLILDPGIGFAKAKHQNFELLNKLKLFQQPTSALHGFPILIGPSRKRFLGDTINEPNAKGREWATAAATAACVAGGADIVRVHNVKSMLDVILVADRIWRSQ